MAMHHPSQMRVTPVTLDMSYFTRKPMNSVPGAPKSSHAKNSPRVTSKKRVLTTLKRLFHVTQPQLIHKANLFGFGHFTNPFKNTLPCACCPSQCHDPSPCHPTSISERIPNVTWENHRSNDFVTFCLPAQEFNQHEGEWERRSYSKDRKRDDKTPSRSLQLTWPTTKD